MSDALAIEAIDLGMRPASPTKDRASASSLASGADSSDEENIDIDQIDNGSPGSAAGGCPSSLTSSSSNAAAIPVVRKLKFGVDAPTPARPATAKGKEGGEPVMVCLRIRPISVGSAAASSEEAKAKLSQATVVASDDSTVDLRVPKESQTFKNGGDVAATFSFTKVFGPDSTQQAVFDFTAMPLVNKLFKGEPALIFAYGITNSGKTFTMQGTDAQPGIMTNMLREIFGRIDVAKADAAAAGAAAAAAQCVDGVSPAELRVEASYLEIYQEKVYDLLSPAREGRNVCKVMVNEDKVVVTGQRHIAIKSFEEASEVVRLGSKNRVVAQTLLNSDSSRSHSIFTVRVRYPGSGGKERLPVPLIWIVCIP